MDNQESHPSDFAWTSRAWERIRVLWLAKMIGSLVCMTLFFAVYFLLLNFPRFPVSTVPRIFVDRLVPFQPGSLPLYVSLWVYVLLAPALLPDRRALWSYLAAVVALSVVGFGIFLIWPTAVPKPEIPWPEHTLLSYLKVVDASGNAFPSLHTAFAVFTAAWLGRLLRGIGAGGIARALNWLWCAGIVYSTLATRQHVALDALAGAALGAAGALIHFRILGALRARSGSA